MKGNNTLVIVEQRSLNHSVRFATNSIVVNVEIRTKQMEMGNSKVRQPSLLTTGPTASHHNKVLI
jgi:hypothetical protein